MMVWRQRWRGGRARVVAWGWERFSGVGGGCEGFAVVVWRMGIAELEVGGCSRVVGRKRRERAMIVGAVEDSGWWWWWMGVERGVGDGGGAREVWWMVTGEFEAAFGFGVGLDYK
ncbi:hypothetical protein U1Q18_022948 [Sarracenia purpurea var. burkii]